MSQALIAEYYAHFNRGNFAAMLSLLADDVIHDLNQGEREVGKPAFAAFLERMQRSYDEQLSEVRILASADGSHAAAEYVVSGVYLTTDSGLPPASGQRYRLPGGAFFDIRNGQIARVSNYYNLQDWLRQIGA
jgi:steroid delta-isomerase-like uncharacterized protein